MVPPPPDIACLSCSGGNSRCPDQRPCGDCTNNGLECIWKGSEPKPKRHSRQSRPSCGARTSRKVTREEDSTLQVRNACTHCQQRKGKCSGNRPACTHCVERQLNCSYNVAEGATRTNDLKRKLRESSTKEQAFGLVLEVMRKGTDYQATMVLARLRIGDTLEEICCSLSVSTMHLNSDGPLELNRGLLSA
jgi:hypothetical protein